MMTLAARLGVSPQPSYSIITAIILIASVLSVGCSSKPDVIELSGTKMGTTYNITVVADQLPPDDLHQRIDNLLSLVDNSMSTYKSDSELSRFNRMAVGQEMQISEDFARVLQISHDVWQRSGGAFDPTIGPLVDLWGFGPTVTDNTAPSTQQLSLAVRDIGFQHLILDDLSLSKTRPVQLDLSAVAKGYAVDLVADMLEMLGLPDYLVEIGGEIRASGSNPNGQIWRVAIEEPALISSVNRVIPVAESAVATSGDYRNYFEQEGIRYSHILDPRSGSPIKHNLASVTVLSNSCAEADAWATAFLVMGAEPSLQLAEQLKLPVYLLTKEGDTFKGANSEAFEPFLLLPTDQVAL